MEHSAGENQPLREDVSSLVVKQSDGPSTGRRSDGPGSRSVKLRHNHLASAFARLVSHDHRSLRSNHAQTVVEFALILPVLLALLFVIVESGRLF